MRNSVEDEVSCATSQSMNVTMVTDEMVVVGPVLGVKADSGLFKLELHL